MPERFSELIHSRSAEVLRDVASNAGISEELALGLLARRELPHQVLEAMAKNGPLMKHRKVVMAVVSHPRTPRHVSIPITRHLYTFELMQLALLPTVAADLRLAMEETLVSRLETISSGERLTLAKRGSGGIAAALLNDPEEPVIHAALANPQMTEACIVKALLRSDVRPALVEAVCRHSKWCLRRDVQVALLRNDKTPLARALAFAQSLPTQVLRDVLSNSRLDAALKSYLVAELERRATR